MACRVDNNEDWRDVFKENSDLLKRIDVLTDMLCRLCESCDLETSKLIDGAGQDVREWWETHKKADEERIERDLKVLEQSIKNYEDERAVIVNKQIELQASLNKKYDQYAALIKDKERIFNRR